MARFQRVRYLSTTADTFYFGKGPWHRFNVLTDLSTTFGNGYKLEQDVRQDLSSFMRTQNIAVDLPTFITTPAVIWTRFLQLKNLDVVLYGGSYVPRENAYYIEGMIDNWDLEHPRSTGLFDPKADLDSFPPLLQKRADYVGQKIASQMRRIYEEFGEVENTPHIRAVYRCTANDDFPEDPNPERTEQYLQMVSPHVDEEGQEYVLVDYMDESRRHIVSSWDKRWYREVEDMLSDHLPFADRTTVKGVLRKLYGLAQSRVLIKQRTEYYEGQLTSACQMSIDPRHVLYPWLLPSMV